MREEQKQVFFSYWEIGKAIGVFSDEAIQNRAIIIY